MNDTTPIKPVVNGSNQIQTLLGDLKRRRKMAGLTQGNMAEQTGLSYQSINRMENNAFNDATVYNLIRYLNALEQNGINTGF